MAATLFATIGGVDVAKSLEGIDLAPSGAGVIGTATLHLSQKGGGYTIADKAEVKVWEESAPGVVSFRYLGGFVMLPETGSDGTEKLWDVQCQDYNLLLHTMCADASFIARVWDHGVTTFEDQIDYITRQITRNDLTVGGTIAVNNALTGSMGGSPPTVGFSGGGGSGAAATALVAGGAVAGFLITNPGTNYTSAPTVSITGGTGSGATATATVANGQVTSLTLTAGGTGYNSYTFSHQGNTWYDILTERCQAYSRLYPATRPAFYMSAGTTGAVAPQLEIYDAAVISSTPLYHYTDNPSGGSDRPFFGVYDRKIDGTRTATRVQGRAMIGSGSGQSLAVQTAVSSPTIRNAHPNNYDQRIIGGSALKAWQDPAIDVSGAKSGSDIQASIDRYLASRENGRESITFDVIERLLPGNTVAHTNSLEGISNVNYKVAGAKYDFSEYPAEHHVTVTLGAVPLEVGEGGNDDVLPAPIIDDGVPPGQVPNLHETGNVWDPQHASTAVTLSWDPSPANDVDYYVLVGRQDLGPVQRFEPIRNLYMTVRMIPEVSYFFRCYAVDTHGNVGEYSDECFGTPVGPSAPPNLKNPTFAIAKIEDPTQPRFWTKSLDGAASGASGALSTAVVLEGPNTIKLHQTGGDPSFVQYESDPVHVWIPSTASLSSSFGVFVEAIVSAAAATGKLTISAVYFTISSPVTGTAIVLFSGTPVVGVTKYTRSYFAGPGFPNDFPTDTKAFTLRMKYENSASALGSGDVYVGGCRLEERNVASADTLGNVKQTLSSDGNLSIATLAKWGLI